MLNKTQIETMGLLCQNKHRLEGRLEVLKIAICDIKHIPNDSYNNKGLVRLYEDLQKKDLIELDIITKELAKLYNIMKG